MKKCLAIFDSGVGFGDCFISIPTISRLKEKGFTTRLITLQKNVPVFELFPDLFEGIYHMNTQQQFYTNDFHKVINCLYWWQNGKVCDFGRNVIDYFGIYNHVFEDEFDGWHGLLPDPQIPKDVTNKVKNMIYTSAKGRPTVLLQSLTSFWNKMIGPEAWPKVVRALKNDFSVIQIGGKQHCPGTVDLTEKTSIVESIALAQQCDILLGGDSWLGHSSGFVKTPGVFVWCSTSPEDYGYPWNRNIWHPEINDCMPCGRPFRWLYDYEYPNPNSWKRSETGWICPDKYCAKSIDYTEIVDQVYRLWEEMQSKPVDFTFGDYHKIEDDRIMEIKITEDEHLVSFVCVLYDKIDKTPEVIQSIRDNCPYPYEIVLVDNGDNGLHDFRGQENIRVLDYTSNLGYSGGNNAGTEFSNGDYIVIINPDMILKDEKCIKNLIKFAGTNAISGKLVGTKDWYTYPASFPTYRVAGEIPFYYDEPTHNMPGWKPMPYIDGSLLCFHRDIFIKTGGFDTDLPELVYFDEAPLLFRAYLNGFKIVDAQIDQYIDHQHTDYESGNVIKWTKANRQYFYETYALQHWPEFLKYLSGNSIKK